MNKIGLVVISMGLLLFFGCKKDEKTDAATQNAKTTVNLHFHNVFSNNKITYGTTYADTSGRKIQFDIFQFYISQLTLIRSDNSELKLSNYALVKSDKEVDYDFGEVPEGDYKGIKIGIGVDSVTNHSDITLYNDSNPLAAQTPSMHWTWSTGYIFLMAEGKVDTTIAKTGTADAAFAYHIALDKLYKQLDFSGTSFTVKKGVSNQLLIMVNINELLAGVDLKSELFTHSTAPYFPLAQKIVNNYTKAFKFE